MTKTTIGYSPLTKRVYLGKINSAKPDTWIGDKEDITSDFIRVLFQKFEPGYKHQVTVNGAPGFEITVKKVKQPNEETP